MYKFYMWSMNFNCIKFYSFKNEGSKNKGEKNGIPKSARNKSGELKIGRCVNSLVVLTRDVFAVQGFHLGWSSPLRLLLFLSTEHQFQHNLAEWLRRRRSRVPRVSRSRNHQNGLIYNRAVFPNIFGIYSFVIIVK